MNALTWMAVFSDLYPFCNSARPPLYKKMKPRSRARKSISHLKIGNTLMKGQLGSDAVWRSGIAYACRMVSTISRNMTLVGLLVNDIFLRNDVSQKL